MEPRHEGALSTMKLVLWAALSGVAVGLSFAPVGAWPLAWVALAPFWFALGETRSKRGAVAVGAVFGASMCLVGMEWLRNATPAALVGLSIYFALFYGGMALCLRPICRWGGRGQPLLLAAAWVGSDFLIGRLFTGIPWLFLGYTQVSLSSLIQIADVTGVHGVTFLCASSAAVLTRVVRLRLGRGGVASGGAGGISVLLWAVAVAGAWAYGHYGREDSGRENAATKSGLTVAVIQPNIPQQLKDSGNPIARDEVVRRNDELTRAVVRERRDIDVVLWAETMNPYQVLGAGKSRDFARGAEAYGGFARRYDAAFLLGTLYWDPPAPEGELRRYRNSVMLFDRNGAVAGRFDKLHPIPWGEYVPLRIGFLESLLAKYTGFPLLMLPGEQRTVFRVDHGEMRSGRFSALICFDIIYPRYARQLVRGGADFLVNVTNEAWFRESAEFDQLLAQSIFRAIENRTDVVRATNSGISGWVDYRGRVRERIVIDGRDRAVQGTLVCRPTRSKGGGFYTRFGDVFAVACSVVGIFTILWTRRRVKVEVAGRE